LDHDGAWLSLGGYHPVHGFVELTGLPAFDERRRGDPDAVRAYRALMADSRFAFLALEAGSWHVAPVPQRPTVEQDLALRSERPVLRFRGTLDRPALAEITETDPPQPTGATTRVLVVGARLRVEAPELPAAVEIDVDGTRASWEPTGDGARLLLDRSESELRISCTLRS
jgi:hypothetical protein